MSKKYRSDAMAAIHETLEARHDVGAVDKQTMRRFDDACLTPIRPLKPGEIKAIRETNGLTGQVHLFVAAPGGFSFYLGQRQVSVGTVTLYEFDFEGGRGGSYQAALTLPVTRYSVRPSCSRCSALS